MLIGSLPNYCSYIILHIIIYAGLGPVGCGDPGIPENGRRNGDDFRFGATVYYECNDNFQLVGPASRICQNSGLWDGFLPTCSIAG